MITTIAVTSVSDYITKVNDIIKSWKSKLGYVWYRGVSSSSYQLIPRIMRESQIDEELLIQEFVVNYQAIHGDNIDDNWELYALMQHYRLPTRLLDWTKSPLVALYFALEKEDPSTESRVVWVMNPTALNIITWNLKGIIIPAKIRNIRATDGIDYWTYLPKSLRIGLYDLPIPQKPIAIEPPLTNKRILYQQGCFTVHGIDNKPIERYFRGQRSYEIVRLIINGVRRRKKMSQTIHNLGLTEDYVYQDLESLSKRSQRQARRRN